MITPRSTPSTRAHTVLDCTPLLLARLPALDSRKAKPGNGVRPRMVSYLPTEGDEEPSWSMKSKLTWRCPASTWASKRYVR